MSQPPVDPRTPVVVGVGQASERLGTPGYRRLSPVDLAAEAAAERGRGHRRGSGGGGGGHRYGGRGSPVRELRSRRASAAGPVGQLSPVGGGPDRGQPGPGRAGSHRRPGAAAPGQRDRRRDRRRRQRGDADLRVGGHLHHRALREGRGPARLHRAPRRQPGRPRLRAARPHLHEPDGARAHRRSQPVRADRKRPPGQAQADPGGVRGRDGRAVRAVHPGGRGQPARVRAGRAQRGRAGHADRGEPAHRRPVYPVHRGPGEGQPRRRGAADVGGRGGPAGRAAQPEGVPARARGPEGAGLHGPGRPVGRPGVGAGRPARPRCGRHRPRRPGHDRPVQLFPGAGVQHLRRPGPGSRGPARSDRDRRAAVLRRRGQQLLDARHRRDRPAGPPLARQLRPRRRQRRRDEQVLRRGVLHQPGRVAAGPQRRPASRD